MKNKMIAASVLFAIGLSAMASAQSIVWSQRVYGREVSPGSNWAYAPATSLSRTRPLMVWSAAGTPGVVVAGRHDSGSGLVAKLSPTDGSELWRADLDNWWGRSVTDVQVDAAGDVITAGEFMVRFVSTYWLWSIEKTSGSTGAPIWHQHLSPPIGNGAIEAIATDHANDILALGSRREETNPVAYVVKFSGATGDIVWSTPIPYYIGPQRAWIAVDASGNAFASPRAGMVAKVLSNGVPAWAVDLSLAPALACALIRDLKIDSTSGDVIIAGRKNCAPPEQGFVARLDSASGGLVWTANNVGDADASDVTTFAFAADGTVVAAGGRAFGFDPQHWFAAKLSLADGAVVWTAPGPVASRAAATDVAIGPDGEVLLTGICDGNAFCAARLSVGQWALQTGDAYVPAQENYPSAILAAGGGVYFGGKDTSGGATTWTVHRIDNVTLDAIFANGFE